MNFDAFKKWPVSGFGGVIDYQGPTRVHPGSALIARNMTFNRRRARQRDGMVDTAFRQTIQGAPITGYDVLEVVGDTNPGLYLIAFTQSGLLYIEQPSGSGCFVPLATPFALPTNARMQSAAAYNSLYMVFTDGLKGLCPPLRYNGLTGAVEPASQNPTGARWTVGRFAQVGDLVSDINQNWWRCTQAGFMGVEPTWPGQVGYFNGSTFTPATATSVAAGLDGTTIWEEWTPGFESLLPAPNVASTVGRAVGVGTVPTGKDLYLRIAYNSDETGEGPWSDPVIFVNTPASKNIEFDFQFNLVGPIPGGPSMPRWLAELNLRSDAFFPFLMNVYAAIVNTGSPAPTVYYQVAADYTVGAAVTISADPSTGTVTPISRPSTATSPDPAFSGTVAFSNPTFANDGSSATAATGKGESFQHTFHEPGGGTDEQTTQVSCSALWTGFTAPPATPSTIFLFVDYQAVAGLLTLGNTVGVQIQYTLDNGSTWVTITSFSNTGQARTVFSVALAGGQDYTHIKVRAEVSGGAPSTDGNTAITLSIYDIRVGVNATVGQILLQKTASGVDLFGPPLFTGETGLRYVIIIREDDTGSLSPVDPASPIPILFTNGESQRIAILPHGAPNTATTILALTVSGEEQAGPFFDITVSNPPNPASSQITAINRDGNGNVTATVIDASDFEAGSEVLVYGVGSGLDGSFPLATVDTSINQLSWGQDGSAVGAAAGNVIEEQNNLRTAADAPDTFFSLNFDDDFLSNSRDDTNQLVLIPVPNSTDVSFLPSLQKMCFVDDTGSFFFSQTQDPGNVSGDGGELQVEAAKGGRGIGAREMTNGQIVALKTNGGYQLATTDVTPANWTPERLWELHGPPCAAMIALGEDFLVFGCEGGAYFFNGADPVWLSQEIQSDDEESGSWNQITWKDALNFWAAVDEDSKEVHFGVCTDGSGFPNEVYRLSYTGGWDFPEARTRTGSLITPDTARKWSRDPIATRIGRYLKRTLVTPTPCAGDPYNVSSVSRSGGVVTIEIVIDVLTQSEIPVGVGDMIQVAITSDSSFAGDFELTGITSSLSGVFLTIVMTYAQPGATAAITGGDIGTLAAVTTVVDNSLNKPMQTKQMTYSLPTQPKWKQYPILQATRSSQVVSAIVQASSLVGDSTDIIVDGANSFDGRFTATGKTNNGDGTWTLTWTQEDVDETIEQGELSTTIQGVRLTAFQPGRLDDNGEGIDAQFAPSYTSDGNGGILRFGGIRGMARGTGKMFVHMITEDASITLDDQDIDLKDGEVLTQFAREASNGDPLDTQFASPLFTNGALAGNGFELVQLTVYANVWLPGTDE